jgi:lipopolysaccharide export system protein LptA
MRRTRRLILAVILLIIVGLGLTYSRLKTEQKLAAPPPPRELPRGISGKAENWDYSKTEGSRTIVRVLAKKFTQVADTPKYLLEQVDLRLFHKDGKAYDDVKSAKAEYDTNTGILFSEGDVEITMGVPDEEKQIASGKLLVIKSSGVQYDSKNGKATTDRPASFTFDRGDGQATGAEYDPTTRELNLRKDVTLHWRGTKPQQKEMEIQSGALVYKEKEAKVYLSPWSKLKRDTLTMEGGDAVVTLKEGAIQLVEAQHARGIDKDPKRQLDYAADQLRMDFDENGEVKTVSGEKNAKLISVTNVTQTTVTSDRVDLAFNTEASESILQKATATGNSIVESKPVPKPNVAPPDTRILKSDAILLNMQPDGKEIHDVETHAPGSVEFIPNRPGLKHRVLNGERMWITYGPQNQIQSFRAVTVSTRTDSEVVKGKTPAPPALTWSKDLLAEFEPKGGQMTKLEQWHDFRYEEGDRKARSERAVLDYPKNLITLEGGGSRIWDPTGSTSADKIILNQDSGDVEAIGNVNSNRQPDKKKKDTPSGLLSGEEPVQAKAARMTSTDDNQHIRYEGNAILWQGANRLQADRVDIDRENSTLTAHGKVVSQFVDKGTDKAQETGNKSATSAKPADSNKQKAAVFTVIKAPDMSYSDEERIAHYTGGVLLTKPGMTVQSKELRAFLKDSSGSDSSLDKAFADGTVKIVQVAVGRTRTGTGEHAEYYVSDAKVILEGGKPQLVDSVEGTSRGKQLTYFSNNGRLLVTGADAERAVSDIKHK